MAVRILHPPAGAGAGELERALASIRAANAGRLAALFEAAGGEDVEVVITEAAPAPATFGERLRGLAAGLDERAGLVVLGSGSIPLADRRFAQRLLEVAGSGHRRALANGFYSADVVAVGGASNLASAPDLPTDNALPRWLRDEAGYEVSDAGRRWRLAIDLDSPLDALLIRTDARLLDGIPTREVADRLARVRAVAADPRAELVVAGRTSAATLRWLERRTASRTRALVEERGLRAIGLSSAGRPPRSLLGLVLDDRAPQALAAVLRELGDAAVIDSRILLAHRLGPDEARWPRPEDRYASDMLLAERIADPWLRALTEAARDSAIPVILGGHTVVGPGLRLLLGRRA